MRSREDKRVRPFCISYTVYAWLLAVGYGRLCAAMRKKRVVQAGKCYHLVSRVAHMAFFFDDDEKNRFVIQKGLTLLTMFLCRPASASCHRSPPHCRVSGFLRLVGQSPAFTLALTRGNVAAICATMRRCLACRRAV